MGDPFFVISWMKSIGEQLHSMVLALGFVCKVVLIFKSLNETLLMREFHSEKPISYKL